MERENSIEVSVINRLLPVPWEVREPHATDVRAAVLRARGLDDPEQAEHFGLAADPWHDPSLFCDMTRALDMVDSVLRESAAVDEVPTVLIFGDYDADGVCAAAILARYFGELGFSAKAVIPDRFDDGYGLNPELTEAMIERKPDLIVTVDCGTSSPAEAERIVDAGIRLIITDHHPAAERPNRALCPYINPALSDETYPFPSLCGAGVALKFVQALCRRFEHRPDNPRSYEVIATVATVADVMPLIDENRVLVRQGLAAFESNAPSGLKALARSAGFDTTQHLKAQDIAFRLGPRLNAAGRMGRAELAYHLMMSESDDESSHLADILEDLNTRRRLCEQAVTEAAIEQIERENKSGRLKLALAWGTDWHRGVLGITSSRLVDYFRCPAITLSEHDGLLVGSARSFGDLNIAEAVASADDLLEKHGGHALACGLMLKKEQLEAFRARIGMYLEGHQDKLLAKPFYADTVIHEKDVSPELVDLTDMFEPTGQGNEKPGYLLENIEIKHLSAVGADRSHLRFRLGHRHLSGIAFGLGEDRMLYKPGDRIDLIGRIERNHFRGRTSLQFQALDLRPAGEPLLNRRAATGLKELKEGSVALMSEEIRQEVRSLNLEPNHFASVWRAMTDMMTVSGAELLFSPVRLVRVLSSMYNVHLSALGILCVLTVFDEAGLSELDERPDATFCYRILYPSDDNRPKLGDTFLWRCLDRLGGLHCER